MNNINYISSKRLKNIFSKYAQYDQRTDFQKDYHSIISSSAFRILQDKTQVFPLDKSDYVRTRLTHSLEVASIARSLVQASCNYFKKNNPNIEAQEFINNESDISDIVQCAGLLHDIGNPPFGHFGEDIISDWFEQNLQKIQEQSENELNLHMKQDLMNFEGNAQAFRIITRLQNINELSASNLTFAVINSIVKYPIPSQSANKNEPIGYFHKFGYFLSEKEFYDGIIKETGYQQRRNILAYILEAADDIAYRVADIDDAIKKEIISYEQLYYELINNQYLNKQDEQNYLHLKMAIEEFEKPEPDYSSAQKSGLLKHWLVGIQSKLIAAASFSFTKNFEEILQGIYPDDLFENSYSHYLMRFFKDISEKYIYDSPELLKLEIAANEILEFLLDKFCYAVIEYDPYKDSVPHNSLNNKLCKIISENYKEVCKDEFNWLKTQNFDTETKQSYQLYFKLLLVTDFISGMTDSYAKRLYQELKGFYL